MFMKIDDVTRPEASNERDRAEALAILKKNGMPIQFTDRDTATRNRMLQEDIAAALSKARVPDWQPIDTAPLNQSVLIFIPSPIAEHYGAAIYRGLKKQSVNGREVWMVTSLHSGSDLAQSQYRPSHWLPLPDPPKE